MNEFDDDAVARIVRRAVELDAELDAGHGSITPGIDRVALVQAATEAGVDRASIELAIAEHLVRPAPEPERFDRLVGPRYAAADRRISLPAGEVEKAITEWLTRARFRPLRREPQFTVWDRRTDVAAGAQRLAASMVGGDRFRGVSRVEVETVPVDASTTLVQIRADRLAARGSALATSGGLVTLGAAGVAAGVVVAPALAVLSVPAAAAAVALALGTKSRTERTSADVERLLDQVAAADRPNLLGVPRTPIAWRGRHRRADLPSPVPGLKP